MWKEMISAAAAPSTLPEPLLETAHCKGKETGQSFQ